MALFWSLFQLWIASPIPFALGFGVFNDTEARSIHLALALFLAYLAYPALKSSPRDRIPLQDWVLAAVASFCAAYLFLFYNQWTTRPSNPQYLRDRGGLRRHRDPAGGDAGGPWGRP